MRAARLVVERAAHGTSEHTYGVNTGFGRFVSKSIPEELTKELQLRLLRSHACGVGDAVPRRGRARGDAAARQRAREGLLGRAHRDRGAAARLPEPRICSRTSPAEARSARAATSRRSRTSRSRWSARVRRRSDGKSMHGARRARGRRSRARSSSRRRRASRSSTARSSWPRSARSDSYVRVVSRRPPTSRARSRSRRCRARGRASFPRSTRCRPLPGQRDSAANVLRLLEGSAINESHRWCDKVQDAYSLRCAAAGARRDCVTCSTTSSGRSPSS